MKNQIYKDKKKRKSRLKIEREQLVLKSLYKNTSISKAIRWNSGLKFTYFAKESFSSSFVSRCVLTGRQKKISPLFRFSRLSFLKYARKGYISGLKKSVW